MYEGSLLGSCVEYDLGSTVCPGVLVSREEGRLSRLTRRRKNPFEKLMKSPVCRRKNEWFVSVCVRCDDLIRPGDCRMTRSRGPFGFHTETIHGSAKCRRFGWIGWLRLVVIQGGISKGQKLDRLFGKPTGSIGEPVHPRRGIEKIAYELEDLRIGGPCHRSDNKKH